MLEEQSLSLSVNFHFLRRSPVHGNKIKSFYNVRITVSCSTKPFSQGPMQSRSFVENTPFTPKTETVTPSLSWRKKRSESRDRRPSANCNSVVGERRAEHYFWGSHTCKWHRRLIIRASDVSFPHPSRVHERSAISPLNQHAPKRRNFGKQLAIRKQTVNRRMTSPTAKSCAPNAR